MKISLKKLAAALLLTLGTVGVAQAQTNAAQDANGVPTDAATISQPSRNTAQTVLQGKTRDQLNAGRAQAARADDGVAANGTRDANGRRTFHDGRKLDQHFLTQP